MNKGQALALVTFMIFIILVTVIVLFMPINQQLIRIGKLLAIYQALTLAESGIEVGNLYLIKDQIVSDFTASSNVVDNSICRFYFDYFCSLHNNIVGCNWTPSNCGENRINGQNINIKAYIYKLTQQFQYSFYTKVISQSQVKEVTRVLDFDFAP